MKKKLICFLICTLLTFSFVTTGTSFFDEKQQESVILDDPLVTPKKPGHMTDPYPSLPVPEQISVISHQIPQPINAPSPEVIDMIIQLTEPLYLGFLENLTAFGPRETGTQACWNAGDWIYDQFEDMGLQVRYHNWSYKGYSGSNIEATIPGTDPTSDGIYLVCAHYDSVSGSPGADDDGSGVVAAMTAAYIMRDYTFNHTLRFVAFSGEEQGLLGSHEYVVEAYNNGDNIIGALNADMIGFALTQYQGDRIIIYEDESDWLYYYTEDISQQYTDYIGLITLQGGFSWGSDHYYFWEYGYDALFYHEYEFNHFYHSPADNITNMNITYAVKGSRLILATLAELAQSITLSDPPNAPTISGPTNGIEGLEYDFTFVTTDPNGDEVFYYIGWGDGTNSGWIGPYPSDEEVIVSNTWFEHGTYDIKAKAKDTYNAGSEWSDPFTINIAEGPKLDIEPIVGGLFKVKAVIKNTGAVEANSVNWKINLNGGLILIGEETSDTILTIPAGGEQTINSGLILGLGKPIITVTAEIPTDSDIREQQAFLLGFVIVVNPGGSL
ncbi:MAG: Zn-dependent exopeptidase M28 [Thermoplasmatales archaeon]|nr:MAG: Zn-dependent exopeptidase M28 [Thermoplasmatales archaeon]